MGRYKVTLKVFERGGKVWGPYAYLQQTVYRGPGQTWATRHVAYLGRLAPRTRHVLPDHLAELIGQRAVLIPALTDQQARALTHSWLPAGKVLPTCGRCGGAVLRFETLDGPELRCILCGRGVVLAA